MGIPNRTYGSASRGQKPWFVSRNAGRSEVGRGIFRGFPYLENGWSDRVPVLGAGGGLRVIWGRLYNFFGSLA